MKHRLFNIGVALDQLVYTLITLGAMTCKQKLQAPTSEATYN